MRSSVERRKLQRCLACYIKSCRNLLRQLLKETCWTLQLACNVTLRAESPSIFLDRRRLCSQGNATFIWEKYKTLCWLSNWIQRSIQKKVGSGERRAELRRSTRQLQSVIKVSSWRLYNVYNQQDQKPSSTIWSSIKRSLRGRRLRSNSR